MAAEQYLKAVELDPLDIDARVFAAESLAEAGQYDEAGGLLQEARSRTDDPRALRVLDGCLQRLADARREASGTR